jgi:hypothetical protein
MKSERLTKNLCTRNAGFATMLILVISGLYFLASCEKDETDNITPDPNNNKYTIEQTLSDEAQRNTISFDALGFMTGSLGSQTFLPPGKVADYSGFQYLRDNDLTNLGHNTSFVTIIAFNVLNILDNEQIQQFVDAANDQVSLINEYAYKRYPLCDAFRRLIEGDLPAGTTGLDKDAVQAYSAELYKIDGEISYGRAQVFGQVISSLSNQQVAELNELKALDGVGNWDSTLQDPLKDYNLPQDVNIAVMTYASEIYSWYAGSVEADVYFCPERQGTYFGSFYLKDWPAMGNSNYTINEQLTASAGQDFLKILSAEQSGLITGLVHLQEESLQALVGSREDISVELRKYLAGEDADSSLVYSLSEDYGRYDGEIIYLYATHFSQVYQSLSQDQKDELVSLADGLGYIDPTGAFLYSSPIPMPQIENTDYFFK